MQEVFSQTEQQLCWLHKTRNILDNLPKAEHKESIERLRAIYLAENRAEAERLARKLIRDWNQAGYERALEKLLTFFEFPAEHAKHLRTTNPIESVFASVRLRTKPMKRLRTAKNGLHLVFKLLERAKKRLANNLSS